MDIWWSVRNNPLAELIITDLHWSDVVSDQVVIWPDIEGSDSDVLMNMHYEYNFMININNMWTYHMSVKSLTHKLYNKETRD